MASLAQSNSKLLYSWWWNSHISPKNSKWLQENLTDTDAKVKQIIKLIEEDADSFARRAEMYYKKRPELMKLVEEFYRAYRALAERYDHATGVLRQAHRTMAEAFPNQEPFMLVDDSPSAPEADPRTPGFSPVHPPFDPDEMQKDASGTSLHTSPTRRNGVFAEASDSGNGRKGLRQFNDLSGPGGRTKKSLNFQDAESPDSSVKKNGSLDLNVKASNESELLSKAEQEISTLKNVLARLESEKEAVHLQYQQTLEKLSCLESEVSRAKEDSMGLNEQARKAQDEVQTLKEALAKLEAEREAGILQCQQYIDKITNLENSISQAQKDAEELSEQASKAGVEANSLKEDLGRLEAEKEYALVQHKQCLEKIADMEGKLLHAEEDARRSNERAGKAEREVDVLKQKLAELTKEKEAAAIQYLQCLETIANLERKLDLAHAETKRLNFEMDAEVARFKEAEERCLLLENTNQSMHSELESLAQKMAAQSNELTEKQHELGRLWTCLQEERFRFAEAETAFQTLQRLHIQSQDELKSLAAKFQNRTQMLENLEVHNHSLQNEVKQVKAENKGLNEVNLSSSLTLQNLQEEILLLRETIGKLEADVELRVSQRNALQQEIWCLKEELNELNKKHQGFIEQVESIGLSTENFMEHLKNLLDENLQLKEDYEKERGEKLALMEKLSVMDKLIEKNAVLENSLSDLNVELEGVRDKVKILEESCQYLLAEKSTLVDEKSSLVSQLLIASENLEKITEKNNYLELSLLEANSELQGLQEKSKSLEDFCLLLGNEKSELITARESLISQLDISEKSLESLNENYQDLKEKHFSLEELRESMLHEVEGLKVALDAEKQGHASFAKWSESQLVGLKLQLSDLQEQLQCKSNEYEAELDNTVNAQIEVLVLQESIQDLEEKNFALLLEFQQLLETSKLSKKLISKLEHENFEQKVGANSLLDQIKVLRTGLYNVLKTLDANQWSDYNVEEDKTLLSSVLNKIQETQMFLFELQDANQMLVMENSLLVTLIRQLQLELANHVTAKKTVDQELNIKCEQFLLLQNEGQKLTEMNEEFRVMLMEGEQKREVLEDELKILYGQLSNLQGAHQNLQDEKCKALDDQISLKKMVSDLSEEKHDLEKEYSTILCEAVCQSILSMIFKDLLAEKFVASKELIRNLDELFHENDDLREKGKVMAEKLNELNAIKVEKAELLTLIEDMRHMCDEFNLIQADQETQIKKLFEDNNQQRQDAKSAREVNQKLESELWNLQGECEETKLMLKRLNNQLQNRTNEVSTWESQAEALFGELQVSTVQAALLEGKVHDLNKRCKKLEESNHSRAMEIDTQKNIATTLEAETEELKAYMSTYIEAFISLKDSVINLEKCTVSNGTLHEVNGKEATLQDLSVDDIKSEKQTSEVQSDMALSAHLDLQELQVKIKAIENALVKKERHLVLENSGAYSKLEAAMKHIEELKSEINLLQGVGMGKPAATYPDDKGLGPGMAKNTNEISEEGTEVITKDIILDQISDCSSHGIRRRETLDSDDPMLEMWEAANHDGSIDSNVKKTKKVNKELSGTKHGRHCLSTESVGENKFATDKSEISKKFSDSQQEGNKGKFFKRLDSDAQKLTNLDITVQDLKRKVEYGEKRKKGRGIEYDSVKEQLEESEEAITKLFDVNRKLKKAFEDSSSSFDEKSALALDDAELMSRNKMSELARKGSEKIGRLQLEVQKLQFLLMKLNDENKTKGNIKVAERKTRVLLRDYLYGRTRAGPRQKKGHLCFCVQPSTLED